MAFPTGWNRINIDRNDHMSHVADDVDSGVFDGGCPASSQVKLPEIQSLTQDASIHSKKFLLGNGATKKCR